MPFPAPLQLGQLTLSSPYLLAPLESVTDAPFRALCHSLGAGLTFTEMIRARGLCRNNRATIDLIDPVDEAVPTGLQLMVVNESELKLALEKLEGLAATTHPHFQNLCAVDLNFGCPSPEVIRIGAGPALLKRRAKLQAIFAALAQWKKTTSLPVKAVSAKIRLGLHGVEARSGVYLPIVDLANEHLDFLTVHARHARQGSEAPAQWSAIAEAKKRSTIPIIGNGDVFSRAAADTLHAETGCDGALIARGAIRSPWIFRELTGTGAGLPTEAELETAEAAYRARAQALGSKPKFQQWHAEGFARLRARIMGGQTSDTVPANSHMR